MRITFQYQSLRYQEALRTSLNNYMKADEMQLKQRKLLNMEDSPSAYIGAYNLQRTIDDLETFTKNANNAESWLKQAGIQIDEAIELIQKVKELAINGNNGTHSEESLQALAGEVMGLYERLYDLANAQHMGRYIFSGFQTGTMPFQDKTNAITAMTQYFGSGGTVSPRECYGDMTELASGQYTAEVRIANNICYLTVYDKQGNKVLIDSNSSDDTLKSGNSMSYEMAFEFEPGMVINTGRGFSITLPDDENFTGLRYKFDYTAGATASYFGDDGIIYNQIGYNQNTAINFTGKELFLKASQIIRSGAFTTKTGYAATLSTYFSQLKGANTSIGDSISMKGTDYLGRTLGSASATGTSTVNLDLRNATQEERTLTIGYAGKYYQIEVPADSYTDIDELVTIINRQLSTATYAGSQVAQDYTDLDDMTTHHYAEVQGLNPTDLEIDLSSQIQIIRDGDRLCFTTTSTGNHALISVTGSKFNPLGFDDRTVVGQGKDTVFELGYDFKEDGIQNLNTVHTGIARTDMTAGFTFKVNGVEVFVQPPAGASNEEIEFAIDQALRQAGFGYEVTARITDGAIAGEVDLTITMQNTSFTNETYLATRVQFNGPPLVDEYKMSESPRTVPAHPQEKTMGDLLDFISDLYGGTVNVTLEEGRICIEDIRTGESKSSLQITEKNQGISLPIVDEFAIVYGNYNGFSDDRWTIEYSVAAGAPPDTRDVSYTILNSKGQIIDSGAIVDYDGSAVELRNGVKMVFPDDIITGKTFDIELTANGSLNFGDLNVVQEGSNSDAFTCLMNLYDALMNGNILDGAGAPSIWGSDDHKSTAIPSFEHDMGGNYNSSWKYEVVSTDGRSNYYIQNEFIHKSGQLQFDAAMIATPPNDFLNFTIQYYDSATDSFVNQVVNVDISSATSADDIGRLVTEHIKTTHPNLAQDGIRVVYQDGKLQFESGSGAKNISVIPNDDTTTWIMGIDASKAGKGSPLGFGFTTSSTFEINHFDGINWINTTVILSDPPGYADENAVIAAINTQLGATTVTASLDSNGILVFNSPDPFYYDIISDPTGDLGLGNNTQKYLSGNNNVVLDMRTVPAEERSLTFTYGGNSHTVELPAREYENIQDMVNEMNAQLAAKGIGADFTCVAYGDGALAFEPSAAARPCVIEGNYEGSLGFPKTGDKVTVKVTDDKGNTVQNLNMDTANKYYDVADGVKLGFDRGSLYSMENFKATVGSGVDIELGFLDDIENQLLTAQTKMGNRVSRVNSTQTFNSSMTINAENQKAAYLGSTAADLVELTTQANMAKTAYEYAMAIVTRALSFSILDFLR